MPAFNPNDEPDATFVRSLAELELKTRAHVETWGMGSAKSWNADLERGEISFVTNEDWVVTGPVQVIGTYNSEDGTWLWGWDHPSVSEALAHDARLVRDFGERYGLGYFTRRKVECTEEDAWNFTAIACHLAGAQGAYRGPAGTTFVFMTFGELTIGRGN